MLQDDTRNKIKNITAGIIIEGQQDSGTAIRNFLCSGFETSTTVKTNFEGQSIIKEKQAVLLENYSAHNNLWLIDLPGDDRFLARGGEVQVYFDFDNKTLIKRTLPTSRFSVGPTSAKNIIAD